MQKEEASTIVALAGLDIASWNEAYGITGFHKLIMDGEVPPVRGFVRSPFNPLIYHCVKHASEGTAIRGELSPERKGILLGSLFTDAVTEEETWKDLIHGKKISPIMFPQSVPSSIIGFLTKELQIHGPMSCLGSHRDGLLLLITQAIDWIEDDEADAVQVVCCDIPSIRAVMWTKAFVDKDRSFGGGAVSFVIEKRHSATKQGRKCKHSIEELLKLGKDTDTGPFHGMFNLNDEEESEAN